jgi:hypothetical protein
MTKLSIIVIAYKMPRQLANTLYSLSADYELNVDAQDYEVIVIENRSSNNLPPNTLEQLNGNFRYLLRDESGISPIPALNEGLLQARGNTIGILIDGARLLTPRVLEHTLTLAQMESSPLIALPGYHLAEQEHDAYGPERAQEELDILEAINWKHNGYDIFNHACFSAGNRRGFFHPFMECNALFCTRKAIEKLGGGDERFNLSGGGSFNLHLYRSLGLQADNTLYMLPGDGSFHQYHSGVTTSTKSDRAEELEKFNDQLNSFWNGQFKALSREPILHGTIPSQALRFLAMSTDNGQRRFSRLKTQQLPFWPDDLALQGIKP